MIGYTHITQTHARHAAGFTLIETLVWITVATAAMGAIVISLISFYRANTYTIEQAQAVSSARRSLEKVIATMREAAYASDGSYPVVAMGTSSVTFYADIDDDPLVERVRYFVSGTQLQRGVVEPSGTPVSYAGAETVTVVTDNIRNIEQGLDAFTYYDDNGDVIVDFNDVAALRFIEMNTIVNVSPDRLPNELTIRSSATLRNLQ